VRKCAFKQELLSAIQQRLSPLQFFLLQSDFDSLGTDSYSVSLSLTQLLPQLPIHRVQVKQRSVALCI
jgi:hypothetical protein